MPEKLEFIGLKYLHNFTEFIDGAALVCIIFHHLRKFIFIIACDAVRQNMNGISDFGHIEASGLYAGCGICSGNKKLGDVVCPDKSVKFFTR